MREERGKERKRGKRKREEEKERKKERRKERNGVKSELPVTIIQLKPLTFTIIAYHAPAVRNW